MEKQEIISAVAEESLDLSTLPQASALSELTSLPGMAADGSLKSAPLSLISAQVTNEVNAKTSAIQQTASNAVNTANEALAKAENAKAEAFNSGQFASAENVLMRVVYSEISYGTNQYYRTTPFMPIDRSKPILLHGFLATNVVGIALFDGNRHLVGYRLNSGAEGWCDLAFQPNEYPENACYYKVCSYAYDSAYYSNTSTAEGAFGAVGDASVKTAEDAAFLLFARMWSNECMQFGNTGHGGLYNKDYYGVDLTTKTFKLNDVTMSYRDAIATYAETHMVCPHENLINYCRQNVYARTNFACRGSGVLKGKAQYCCLWSGTIEVFNATVFTGAGSILGSMRGCSNLRRIFNLDLANTGAISSCFDTLPKLEELEITNLHLSISIPNSPLLSQDSLQFIVDNARNCTSAPITITVHADVFNQISASLITDAQAKGITFISA